MNVYEQNYLTLAKQAIQFEAYGGAMRYNACSDFYNYSVNVRPNKMLNFDPKNLLPIGNAFAIIALEMDYGNPDINSISAENAVYCLMRYHKEAKDSWNLPFYVILNLIISDPNLMHDSFMHVVRNNYGEVMDFSSQMAFHSGENTVRYHILKYLIPQVFDIEKQSFKMDDMPLAPSVSAVMDRVNTSFYKHAKAELGERLFEEVYEFCELGVSQP